MLLNYADVANYEYVQFMPMKRIKIDARVKLTQVWHEMHLMLNGKGELS